MYDRYLHRLLLEGVENQRNITQIHDEIKKLEKPKEAKIKYKRFERYFVDVCKELLCVNDFEKIRELAQKRYTEAQND